ncbi:hypothetical protein CHS0354_012552, partial [Potamilus streckersoni]
MELPPPDLNNPPHLKPPAGKTPPSSKKKVSPLQIRSQLALPPTDPKKLIRTMLPTSMRKVNTPPRRKKSSSTLGRKEMLSRMESTPGHQIHKKKRFHIAINVDVDLGYGQTTEGSC